MIMNSTPSLSVWASPSHDLQQGNEATLHCEVNGPDQQTQVQWIKPDGSAHTEPSGLVQLKSVSISDAGTWKCSFSYGGETYNQNLDITVKGEHVTSTRARTIKKQTVASCDILYFLAVSASSYDTTISQPGGIRGRQKSRQWRWVSRWWRLRVSCLSSSLTWGLFSTIARHFFCFFPPVDIPVSHPTQHPPPGRLLGLMWWMWVAIGAGCLVVVVLLILVICFFRRNRRKKVSRGNHLVGNLCGLRCRFR